MVELPGNTKEVHDQKRADDMDFELLSEQYNPMIHSIYHSLHVYKDQEEYYQIGLIALWDASKHYAKQKGRFSTYAYKFIQGRMLMYLNMKTKEDSSPYKTVPIETCSEAGEVYHENYFEKETLLSYFQKLTEMEQKWVLLYFIDGFNNSEIAAKENWKVEAVRSYQKRAMKKFVGKNQPI